MEYMCYCDSHSTKSRKCSRLCQSHVHVTQVLRYKTIDTVKDMINWSIKISGQTPVIFDKNQEGTGLGATDYRGTRCNKLKVTQLTLGPSLEFGFVKYLKGFEIWYA